MQEPLPLRMTVAVSAGLTLLYTPLLKKVPLVKNATVAATIALSPLAGALAAGAVSSPAPPSLSPLPNLSFLPPFRSPTFRVGAVPTLPRVLLAP